MMFDAENWLSGKNLSGLQNRIGKYGKKIKLLKRAKGFKKDHVDVILDGVKVENFFLFVNLSKLQNFAINVKRSIIASLIVGGKQKNYYCYC